MDNQQRGLIALIKSALTERKEPLPEDFSLEAAAETARKHQILPLFYYGALNCGLPSDHPVLSGLFLNLCRLTARSEQQTRQIEAVFASFEKGKIDYMPLKGTLLKAMYPKSEMRTMGDADLLIRVEQYEAIRPLMQELGYTEVLESDHEFVWRNAATMIELHKRLIPSYNKDYYAYFGDGWRLGHPVSEGSTRYEMTPEDEFIYLFTHFAKHYRDAGIGIKHLIDFRVFRQHHPELNEEYLSRELKKLQLWEFYENAMRTLDMWFGDAEADEVTDFITQIIFNSGVYGTHEAHILSAALKTTKTTGSVGKTRAKKILPLVFLPYPAMCERYPILTKLPFLLPIFWVVRWIEVLLFKRNRYKAQKKDWDVMSVDRIEGYQQALNFVGLDFNFQE